MKGTVHILAPCGLTNAIALQAGVVVPCAVSSFVVLPQQGNSGSTLVILLSNASYFSKIPVELLLYYDVLLTLV